MNLSLFPNKKVILSFLLLLLVLVMLYASSQSTKTDQYTFMLSSIKVQFKTPSRYSKDFPKPDAFTKNINIYDTDIYNDSKTTSTLEELYFDYGKGFLFGNVNGTLKAAIQVRKTLLESSGKTNPDQLIKILHHDFDKDFSKQDLKDFAITPPRSINNLNISGIVWSHYEYTTNDQVILLYATALSEQHYLQILFKFIDNSPGEKNNWKEQASEQINGIMQSFSIKSIGN